MAIYVHNQETYDFILAQLNFTLHVLFFGCNADSCIEWIPERWNRQRRNELEDQKLKAIDMYDACVQFVRSINQNSTLDRENLKQVYTYINRLNNIIDFLNDRIKEEKNKKEEEDED